MRQAARGADGLPGWKDLAFRFLLSGFRERNHARMHRALGLLRNAKLDVGGPQNLAGLRGDGVTLTGLHLTVFHGVQGLPERRFQVLRGQVGHMHVSFAECLCRNILLRSGVRSPRLPTPAPWRGFR